MKKNVLLALVVTAISSCEKAISFRPASIDKQPVVEATIEKEEYPRVFLSSSFDYFGKITPQLLQNIFIHDAVINISNGAQTMQLKEYSIVAIDTLYRVYYYTADSSQLASAFKGEDNKTYTLTIVSNGKTYTSTTTIPLVTWTLDTLTWREPVFAEDSLKAIVTAKITERAPYGNYIRYFTKRNREPFLAPYTSAFDDQVVNGTTYSIDVEPGIDRNNPPSSNEPNLFNRGDTVVIKWSNIDKQTFDFWRTLEYNYASVGNPFAAPSKVTGNISGGALGYFGGYNSMYRTIIIPHR
jgi:hypothetical protein